uniref:hypothetical protein n=1 Tax=unclassified Rhodococcus (in: high G+C Gram-positive bacteria) TaxID=192944 RepID=UPI0020CBDEC5|nr:MULTISPECIES: hypothetical protein [unclassified Rhodococcus (in: high G+C Gram-positive bacteria)]
MFLGSNIDAVEAGTDLGFERDKSMTYVSTAVGLTAALRSVVGYQQRNRSAVLGAPAVLPLAAADRKGARGEWVPHRIGSQI